MSLPPVLCCDGLRVALLLERARRESKGGVLWLSHTCNVRLHVSAPCSIPHVEPTRACEEYPVVWHHAGLT